MGNKALIHDLSPNFVSLEQKIHFPIKFMQKTNKNCPFLYYKSIIKIDSREGSLLE